MPTDSTSRIVRLDGLRGFAAVLVVVAHYFGEVPHGFRFLTLGWVGVDIFFVLSGFLMTSVLLRHKSSSRLHSTFYMRRILRIIPVYFTIVTLVLLLTKDPLPPIAYFTFTQNLYMAYSGLQPSVWLLPSWTLCVELQFYLLIPFIIKFTTERTLFRLSIALIFLPPIFRFFLILAGVYEAAVYSLLPSRCDFLFFGVLAAIIQGNTSFREYLLANEARILKVGMIGGAATLLLSAGLSLLVNSMIQDTFMWTCLGLTIASYLLLVLREEGEGRVFESKIWRFLGTISYSLYLVHQPISGLLHRFILSKTPDINSMEGLAVTLLSLACSVAVAWLSWTFFESKLIAVGHRWTYQSIPNLHPKPAFSKS